MKWILHNFWIKLLAVVMAFLLWLHVATERTYEIELTYHLDYFGLAGDLALASQPPQDVQVRCRGSGKQLLLSLFRERVWPVNLSPYTRGAADIELSAREAPTVTDEEVQVLSIVRNRRLHVEIDRLRQKTVPILPAFLYELREGFVRAGPEILYPDSVALSGPATALKAITAVRARPQTFSNLTGPVDARVDLEPLTAYNVISSVKECRLYAEIQQYDEKTFAQVPVTPPRREDGSRLAVDPHVVSVTVGGGRQVLSTLPAPQVNVESTSAVLKAFPLRLKVSAQLPPWLQAIRVEPDSVLVFLP